VDDLKKPADKGPAVSRTGISPPDLPDRFLIGTARQDGIGDCYGQDGIVREGASGMEKGKVLGLDPVVLVK
jgi:hypothetical protein